MKSAETTQNAWMRRFYRCFPTLEDLAQKGLLLLGHNTTIPDLAECNGIARKCAEGHPAKEQLNSLCGNEIHKARFNIKFYKEETIDKYPEKQVFVIRTERYWDDLMDLDKLIGGTGDLPGVGSRDSHGSEDSWASKPQVARVSQSGYQKLCCVLHAEIKAYETILLRAENLNKQAKQRTMNSVYEKCGISVPWFEWNRVCLQQIEHDRTNSQNLQ